MAGRQGFVMVSPLPQTWVFQMLQASKRGDEVVNSRMLHQKKKDKHPFPAFSVLETTDHTAT